MEALFELFLKILYAKRQSFGNKIFKKASADSVTVREKKLKVEASKRTT